MPGKWVEREGIKHVRPHSRAEFLCGGLERLGREDRYQQQAGSIKLITQRLQSFEKERWILTQDQQDPGNTQPRGIVLNLVISQDLVQSRTAVFLFTICKQLFCIQFLRCNFPAAASLLGFWHVWLLKCINNLGPANLPFLLGSVFILCDNSCNYLCSFFFFLQVFKHQLVGEQKMIAFTL